MEHPHRTSHHSPDMQIVQVAPSPPKQFNPGWLAFALSLVVAIGSVGATYRDVNDLRDRMKTMENWKGGQEVAMARLQNDVEHILKGVQEIQRHLDALTTLDVSSVQHAGYRAGQRGSAP